MNNMANSTPCPNILVIDAKELCAEIYPQLTGVEGENNGLMTYDRIPNADIAVIAQANEMPAAGSPAK